MKGYYQSIANHCTDKNGGVLHCYHCMSSNTVFTSVVKNHGNTLSISEIK